MFWEHSEVLRQRQVFVGMQGILSQTIAADGGMEKTLQTRVASGRVVAATLGVLVCYQL